MSADSDQSGADKTVASQQPVLPIILDVEASGFGRGSYPIEVGFVLADGSCHCRLIKPESDWSHWDASAQALHGITPQVLQAKGLEVTEIAHFLNVHLAKQTVYSDAWGNDSSWLGRLFDCAGLVPDFKLESIRAILSESQLGYWQSAKDEVIEGLALGRHRASADAMILQQTYLLSWRHAHFCE